tara:strand:- start:293 stop:1504 length:1212 start_codon:yes stop_codon:yes gene_type:complete
MNIDEVRLLIKQLGKELYADSPERQTRGPFSVDTYEGPMTKEQKLADVEAYQAEMAEKEVYRDALMDLEDALVDASPSVGEKLIANFINLFPMGKRSSTGIGSLVGKEIGEMTEAEAARIAEAQAEVTKYNQMQQEGEPLNSFQMQKKNDAEGILSALPSTGSPGTQEKYFEQLHKSRQLPTSPQMLEEYEAYQDSKGRIEMASGLFMTRAEFEGLMDLDLSDVENLSEAEQDLMIKYNLDVKDIPKGPPKELKDVNENLQGLFDFTDNLLSKDLKPITKKTLPTVENSTVNILDENFASRNPGAVNPIGNEEGQFYPTKNVDALKKLSPTDSKNVLDIFKAEKRSLKMMPEVQMYGSKEKAEVFRDIDKQYEEIFNILNSNIKGYKDGGVIMNYGDYGRSYI